MKHFLTIMFFGGVVLVSNVLGEDSSNTTETPRRLARKDSFFGVHFDFHAMDSDQNIGQNTTPEMVNAIIDCMHPDYIEVDTKGHPGYSSYPTRVGNSNGSFVGDPLRVWRDVTARRGVALYAHYSGIWDNRAGALHPDWTVVQPNGKFQGQKMSLWGPYAKNLMILQLKELALDYSLDGAWVDGDVWGLILDYSDAARQAFTQATGISEIPTDATQPNWAVWCNFHREAYRRWARHYIDEVHRVAPNFQLCCNWAFSEQMPEPVSLDVAFLSGDVCGFNCVDVGRYTSRLFASQGIPWDLMSWSFYDWRLGKLDPPESRKPAIQLMREAACIIAQGGGYQAVFSQAGAGTPPLRDGSVDLKKIQLFGEVAQFCRERQSVCFQATPVPQIAVLLSTQGNYDRWNHMGGNLFFWDTWQRGIVGCLLENQQAVSVLVSQKLAEQLDTFPLVVISGWETIEPELKVQIAEYVKRGGKLLLIGERTVAIFQEEINGATQSESAEAPEGCSLTFYTIGQGTLGAIPQFVVDSYGGNPTVRDFVGRAVKHLFSEPIVGVTGSHDVDVSVMRTTAGKLAVHLVNTSGPHHTAGLIPEITPVGPVEMTIRLPEKPAKIVRIPGNTPCDFTYADGIARLSVDQVPIHEIFVVE